MTEQKIVICPYCGDTQALAERCRACGGLFEPLSRQATHNAMGPWFVRFTDRPFQPGCSYETLLRLIERGLISKTTILRGPTTRQFWTIAKHVPGVSHLLGYCHQCDASVDAGDHSCHACGAAFGAYLDRNYLGLPEIRPLPWEVDHEHGGPGSARGEAGRMWRSSADDDGPRTISSFATNEELLARSEAIVQDSEKLPASFGGSDPADATSGEASSTAVQAAPDAAVKPEAAPVAAPAPIAASMEQSLRRRLDQQQRTIRTLAVIMLVLGAAFVVVVLSWLNPAQPPAAPATNDPAPAVQGEQGSVLMPHADQSVEPMDEPVRSIGDALADYDRAVSLIEAASDTQRPLEQRVADYELAVELLEAASTDLPPEHRPDDLSERLEFAHSEVSRLQYRLHFP